MLASGLIIHIARIRAVDYRASSIVENRIVDNTFIAIIMPQMDAVTGVGVNNIVVDVAVRGNNINAMDIHTGA